MRRVPFVFLAEELDQFRIRQNVLMHGDSPGFGVGLRIVDGHFNFEVPVIGAAEAFKNFSSGSQRAAFDIEPSEIPEAV
jgi:hypothetical protein